MSKTMQAVKVKNWMSRLRDAILSLDEAERSEIAKRDRALMAAREEFYKSVAEDFVPTEDLSCDRVKHDTFFYGTAEGGCCDGADECVKTVTIVLSDGQEKYPRKTAEQIAFTALVMSGGLGSNVSEWFKNISAID